jgi:hypothetical protein
MIQILSGGGRGPNPCSPAQLGRRAAVRKIFNCVTAMQSMHALSHCFFKIDRRFVTYFATQKSGSSAALWVRFGQMPLTICARATPLGSFGRIDRRSEPVGFDRPKCPLAHPLGSIGQNGVFAGPTALGSFGNNCPGGPSRIDNTSRAHIY